jgi:thiol-disulfide isomerase/thioredoxin
MNNTKTFIVVLVAVVLVAAGLIFLSSKNKGADNNVAVNATDMSTSGTVAGASTEDNAYDAATIEKLAKFMTEKGMILYGAYWCPHCQDQKKEFGDAIQYIDYVECDAKGTEANPEECVAQGIEGYPTWIYQGTKYSGLKSLSELAKIVGFSQ